MSGPLSGMLVVDVTRMLPGAVLARLLAEMGARILKVEDPRGGDPMRWIPPLVDGAGAGFATFYRGAESVALDLSAPEGADALRSLVSGADVLLESFRPGTLERWGAAPSRLLELNPSLVICSLSSYGASGARSGEVGHDLNFVGLSGLLDELGATGVPRVQLADVGAALLASSAVLGALLDRQRTGRGAHLEQPLARGPLPFLAWGWADRDAGGGESRESLLGGGVPAYRVYPCADGEPVALGALEPKFWIAFLEMVGIAGEAGDGLDAGPAGAEIARRIEERLAERPREHWLEVAVARGVPLTAVRGAGEAEEDVYYRENAPTRRSLLPGGRDPAALAAVPELGADTARVLSEIGHAPPSGA